MNVLLCIGLLMFIWLYGNYRHSLDNSITKVIVDVIYCAILIFFIYRIDKIAST